MIELKQVTLSNIKDCSLQEVFDWAVHNTLLQGKKSTKLSNNNETACAYRGDGGLKCIIGHCMTDDEYKESFEGESVVTLLRDSSIVCDDTVEELLRDLQIIHDDYNVYEWLAWFYILSKRYALDFEFNQGDYDKEYQAIGTQLFYNPS